MQSKKLLRAKTAKNDEFYTRYEDVKTECDIYRSHFFNKIIYCNCDTANSVFVRYFSELKDKGLIRDIWFSGGLGGADFRSPESIERLKQADLIITNPPFSLFREFMDLLIQYDKKFLVIGNKNAVAYRNIFSQIKNNKIWFGVRRWTGGMTFITPDNSKKAVPAIWFTNLEHLYAPAPISLKKSFNSLEYKRYDNADAININRTADIPNDYLGIMGVPISFLERYNSYQFEILGLDKDFTYDKGAGMVSGQRIYTRIFIKKRPCE